MDATAGADIIGDVAHAHGADAVALRRDEGPAPADAQENTLARQFVQRAMRRHAADAEQGDDLVFRRHARLRRPFAAVDPGADLRLHPLIQRLRPASILHGSPLTLPLRWACAPISSAAGSLPEGLIHGKVP